MPPLWAESPALDSKPISWTTFWTDSNCDPCSLHIQPRQFAARSSPSSAESPTYSRPGPTERCSAADHARIDRRIAEIIDQIWQTDELRAARPKPIDEARSAIFYLEQLATEVLPGLAEEVAIGLERLGRDPASDRRRSVSEPGWEATGTETQR